VKRLSKLLEKVDWISCSNDSDPEIVSVVQDSDNVEPGSVFVARSGLISDGHQYIELALKNGANAIVGELSFEHVRHLFNTKVPYVQVARSSEALAWLAAAINDFPSEKLVLIGVTGTDGKTTTCNIIYSILQAAGVSTGLITTVNAVVGDDMYDTGFHVTTPDAVALQDLLAQMVSSEITHCVVEVTSHALVQDRVASCEFDMAVLTNVTHEHLDYHGTFLEYMQAKELLINQVDRSTRNKLVILNYDDKESYSYFSTRISSSFIDYSIKKLAVVNAQNIKYGDTNTCFDINIGDDRFEIVTPLIGDYNISNCLAAVCVTYNGLSIDTRYIKEGISTIQQIPGRMEHIRLGQEFEAVVDFAHTPNSLKNLLLSVRKVTKGRVIVVFGSAGLRDIEKRKMMGAISTELSDITIITAEDPRTEPLQDIISEIALGCEEMGGVEGATYYKIPDRADAIKYAVNIAENHDIVLACGKAHEQSMCFGNIEYEWDDRIAMKAAISEKLGIEAKYPPELPTSNMDYYDS